MTPEKDIEAAIITAINTAVPALKKVESYDGVTQKKFDRGDIRTPSVYIHIPDVEFESPDEAGVLLYAAPATINIFIATKSMQSSRKSKDDAYVILPAVRSALHNADLSVDGFQSILAKRQSLLSMDKDMAVYLQTYNYSGKFN